MLSKYKLVIFDWDGTLMDSVNRIVSCLSTSADLCGLPKHGFDDLKQVIGLSLEKCFEHLYSEQSSALFQQWAEHYKAQFITHDMTPSTLYNGVLPVLSWLQQQNKQIAVATGKSRNGLDRVLQESEMSHWFSTTRCADETRSKPDPLMLNEILSELNIEAHEAVMVGDTSHDMKLANNAGVDVIGITWGVHSAEILSQYRPVAVIDSIVELQHSPL